MFYPSVCAGVYGLKIRQFWHQLKFLPLVFLDLAISISQALKNLESAGYQQINSVKRAGAGFKAQAKDKNGQNVRIYLDSEGKFIDKPYKRGKPGAGFKHRQQGKRWQKQATPADKQ